MPARVVAIGIDGASPALLRRWAADGTLPVLGGLLRRGRSGTVRSLEGFFVGSTWPSFYTATTPAHHGFHYLVQQRPGSHDLYRPAAEGMVLREPFWRALGRAGRRTAILDVPLVPLDPSVNGAHLVEWGGHDAIGSFATHPAALGERILSRHGPHPQPPDCDRLQRTPEGFRRFVEALERGAATRAEWTRELLAGEEWDLLLQVFSESHCAGHQAWHLHDREHPAHDPVLAATLGDPLRRVYRAIDAGLGRILEAAGDATVVVFACHGMAHWYGAHQLLRPILERLGVTRPLPGPGSVTRGRALVDAARRLVPRPLRAMARRFAGRDAGGEAPGGAPPGPWRGRVAPTDAASRCHPQQNGLATSGIRMNLAGREPDGTVSAAEREALEEELARELLAIVDERTGRPLIRSVRRTRDLYHGSALDILPDLLVDWADGTPTGTSQLGGRGAVVRASSPRIGTVEWTNSYGRTGEHRIEGLVVAAGPGIAPGVLAVPVSVMDLAPTLAALVGVALEGVDGRAIEALGDPAIRG